MIQRFIELGEGYSDLYELLDIAGRSEQRVMHFLALHAKMANRNVTSCAVVLKPTTPGDFQPIYICREGIPYPIETPNERYRLFEQAAQRAGKSVIELDIKPSSAFAEKALYYQYVTGILRLNHYIPPLQ
ncbi:methylthioribose kinase [Domibacillus antri]|uniref:Methylthioribose kinase n=1 Tax=Domibacillus antri TaxID=1714264 RepID=A0A1Q8Q2C4_9BACI|nr:methylthioribose kinase [Domibacillus antri]OLN21486.1 methylthioribose kinase [Domibacillus antri]